MVKLISFETTLLSRGNLSAIGRGAARIEEANARVVALGSGSLADRRMLGMLFIVKSIAVCRIANGGLESTTPSADFLAI